MAGPGVLISDIDNAPGRIMAGGGGGLGGGARVSGSSNFFKEKDLFSKIPGKIKRQL